MGVVLALGLGFMIMANELVARSFTAPLPPPDSIRLVYADAVEGVGLMSLGMRRLAADLAFIRLLMYYGGPGEHEGEPGPEGQHDHAGHEHAESAHSEIGERAIRILDLDPYFSYAVEYAAGALAFNLRRPDDALAVMRHAVARDPKNWKYHAYVAAIAFSKQGDIEKARQQLAPIAADPDCPTMLKHMLAFMNLRLGRRDDAIRLYREVLRSRDTNYHHMAREALARLGVPED